MAFHIAHKKFSLKVVINILCELEFLLISSKLCQETGETIVTKTGFCFVVWFEGISSPPISQHKTIPFRQSSLVVE